VKLDGSCDPASDGGREVHCTAIGIVRFSLRVVVARPPGGAHDGTEFELEPAEAAIGEDSLIGLYGAGRVIGFEKRASEKKTLCGAVCGFGRALAGEFQKDNGRLEAGRD
jgi:hypothetical protein